MVSKIILEMRIYWHEDYETLDCFIWVVTGFSLKQFAIFPIYLVYYNHIYMIKLWPRFEIDIFLGKSLCQRWNSHSLTTYKYNNQWRPQLMVNHKNCLTFMKIFVICKMVLFILSDSPLVLWLCNYKLIQITV